MTLVNWTFGLFGGVVFASVIHSQPYPPASIVRLWSSSIADVLGSKAQIQNQKKILHEDPVRWQLNINNIKPGSDPKQTLIFLTSSAEIQSDNGLWTQGLTYDDYLISPKPEQVITTHFQKPNSDWAQQFYRVQDCPPSQITSQPQWKNNERTQQLTYFGSNDVSRSGRSSLDTNYETPGAQFQRVTKVQLDIKQLYLQLETVGSLFSEIGDNAEKIPILALLKLNKKAQSVTGWAKSSFAKLLAKVESNDDYSAYNKISSPPPKTFYETDLTSLSIAQIQKKQKDREMFAVGRYQIIPSTLTDAVNMLKLDSSLTFDEETQDRIFEDYLLKIKRKALIRYLEGDGDIEDALHAWAKEFASAGVRKGKRINPASRIDAQGKTYQESRVASFEGQSYYAGDGLNTAHISPAQMAEALRESKTSD